MSAWRDPARSAFRLLGEKALATYGLAVRPPEDLSL